MGKKNYSVRNKSHITLSSKSNSSNDKKNNSFIFRKIFSSMSFDSQSSRKSSKTRYEISSREYFLCSRSSNIFNDSKALSLSKFSRLSSEFYSQGTKGKLTAKKVLKRYNKKILSNNAIKEEENEEHSEELNNLTANINNATNQINRNSKTRTTLPNTEDKQIQKVEKNKDDKKSQKRKRKDNIGKK